MPAKNIGIGKWGFPLLFEMFDGGRTIVAAIVWRCNRISSDTTKRRFLWINGYFRRPFIIVGVEQVVYFPQ